MSWLGKLGLIVAACAASGLAAAVITQGAADSDPTHSACVDTANQNQIHFLAAGKDCASLGITGFEIEWDQRGGFSAAEADAIDRSLRHQNAILNRLSRRAPGLNRALEALTGRPTSYFAVLARLMHGHIAIQRQLVRAAR